LDHLQKPEIGLKIKSHPKTAHEMYTEYYPSQFSFLSILYSFSSVAHVWVPGAKTTGPIAKSLVFLKSNFYGENYQISM
jgi:hypothetical protein